MWLKFPNKCITQKFHHSIVDKSFELMSGKTRKNLDFYRIRWYIYVRMEWLVIEESGADSASVDDLISFVTKYHNTDGTQMER